MNTNVAEVSGRICGEFEYSHESYGEKFYKATLSVNRISGRSDIVPITVSERLMLDVPESVDGLYARVKGRFSSYDKYEGSKKRRLILFLFAKEFELCDRREDEQDKNVIYLDCNLSRKAIYRKTPLGREVADVFVTAVHNRTKSDYIPCVAWGRDAKFAQTLESGTHLKIKGRIQSREYNKQISDEESEVRLAYEVSILSMEQVEDENAR